MNVAICIKGAVSKKGGVHDRFSSPGEVYKEGTYINYVAVRNSIFKHIVEANKDCNFDFFLHGWNIDLESSLIELYNPKKYVFEDNNAYQNVILLQSANPSDYGGISGSLSLKKSLELKEIYEIERGFKYDAVIIYRYDVLLWKDMKLDKYELGKYIYVNGWNGSCRGDFHFVMSNNNSNKFKYLFDSVSAYNNIQEFHHWIWNYIVNILQVDVKEDELLAGVFQEHMRVIGCTQELLPYLEKYI
jgi:hypothetical protein